jgi:MFS family permease
MDSGAKNALWMAFWAWAADSMIIHILISERGEIAQSFDVPGASMASIISSTLLISVGGGMYFGWLADKIGRAITLRIAVVWVAASALLCSFAWSYTMLLWLHILFVSYGFGGIWTAGAVLAGEWANPADRGKMDGLVQSGWAVGWGATLALKWLLLGLLPGEDLAWRGMYILGLILLVLVYFAWRSVDDAQVARDTLPAGPRTSVLAAVCAGVANVRAYFADFSANLRANFQELLDVGRMWIRTRFWNWLWTMALSTGAMAGYYTVTLKLPDLLGEGHTEAWKDIYLLVVTAGAWPGYLVGACCSDHFGRRPGFYIFAAGAIIAVAPCTLLTPLTDAWVLLVLAWPLGFFASGVFGGIGAFLVELFPTATRGKNAGSSYSVGRRLAYPPFLITLSLDWKVFVFAAGAYLLIIIAAWLLPETKGTVLRPGAG